MRRFGLALLLVVVLLTLSGMAQAQAPVRQFFAYDPLFLGGGHIAYCDLDGDGIPEIVTAAGAGGGPHIRIFSLTGRDVGGFFAYDPRFTGGVAVACGYGLVLTIAASNGGAHVKVWPVALGGKMVVYGSNGIPIYDGTNCPWLPASTCATLDLGQPFPHTPPLTAPRPGGMLGTDGSPFYNGGNCPVLPHACDTLSIGDRFPVLRG